MSGGVTIKLGVKPKGDGTKDIQVTTHDYKDNGKEIIVTRTTDPPNFYRYTHTLQNGGGQFILKEVKDDKNSPIVIPKESDKKVTSVSAYYWKHDNGTNPPTKVILVEVATTGQDGTKYYKNSDGDKWVEKHNLSTNGEQLDMVLDQQNCYNNNAVTLDLTKDAYGIDGQQPCCNDHKGTDSKISVNEIPVNHNHAHHDHQHVGSENLTVKKYSIIGEKLAAIKLPGEKTRRSITLGGQSFPMDSVESVYALYSGDNQEPVLIYLSKKGDDQNSGWYKNPSSNGSKWEKADGLDGVTPDNITECKNWNSLVGELRDRGANLEDCQETIQQLRETRAGLRAGSKRTDKEEEEEEKKKGDQGTLGSKGGKGNAGSPGEEDESDKEDEDLPEVGTLKVESPVESNDELNFASLGCPLGGSSGSEVPVENPKLVAEDVEPQDDKDLLEAPAEEPENLPEATVLEPEEDAETQGERITANGSPDENDGILSVVDMDDLDSVASEDADLPKPKAVADPDSASTLDENSETNALISGREAASESKSVWVSK
ncbi:hypothetical protein BEWA_026990 [Theileria equi strain WA]|uniref:Uncharacterized protein n=1 Tax=Theileria equi strain WA TaxID=1537102 RepID=L0AWC7_THEEQ|nr:hypothetical protein BEWA_026990 [Theileria equi strain WA]AFZ79850.1 hypothetical protein BEWA_026990 [Theileria equi strain WA]|eukprot:XP_004829516.1 hypothetical protein BEWA_026990 [Theileria equi strain WA]